jgi:hypothetical protein
VQGGTHACLSDNGLEDRAEPYEVLPDDIMLRAHGPQPGRCQFGRESEDLNCTFSPDIRPSSRVRRARTCYEMSLGDYQAKRDRLLKRLQERDTKLEAEHPFKPTLQSPPKRLEGVKGKLCISHPDFIQEYQRHQQRKHEQRRRDVERQEVCLPLPVIYFDCIEGLVHILRKKREVASLYVTVQEEELRHCTFHPRTGRMPESIRCMVQKHLLTVRD